MKTLVYVVKLVICFICCFILRAFIENVFLYFFVALLITWLIFKEHNGFIKKEEFGYIYVDRKKEFVITILYGGYSQLIEDFILKCKREFETVDDTYIDSRRVVSFDSLKRILFAYETASGDYLFLNMKKSKSEKNDKKMHKIVGKMALKMFERYRSI